MQSISKTMFTVIEKHIHFIISKIVMLNFIKMVFEVSLKGFGTNFLIMDTIGLISQITTVDTERTSLQIRTSIKMITLDTGEGIPTFITANRFNAFITVLCLHHN
jgi:hypothetical protein